MPKRDPKNVPEIHATLTLISDAEDTSLNRPQVKLSPEEVARLNEEKADLARDLARKRAGRDSGVVANIDAAEDIEHLGNPRARRAGARRNIEAQPAQPQPTPPTASELNSANAAVEAAEDELRQLELQRKKLERERAEQKRLEEQEHEARRAAMRQRINDAEAVARQARQAHAAAQLASQVEAAELEAARVEAQRRSDVAQKNQRLRERVQPVLDRAVATYRKLKALENEHRPTLDKLAAMSWDKTPATWPGGTRVAWHAEVNDVAIKRRHELHLMLVGLGQNINSARSLLASGWSPDPGFPAETNEAIRLLSYSDDYVRVVEEGLADLHRRLQDIFDRASFDPRAVPDAIVNIVPADLRASAMAEARQRAAEAGQQQRAEGM
jgi:hypothetical protein